MKLHVYVCTLALVSAYQTHSMSAVARILRLKPIAQSRIRAKFHFRRTHTIPDNSPNIIQMIIKRNIKGLMDLYVTNPSAFHTKYDGLTPLHFAVTYPNSLTLVEILIAAGTPLDAQNKDGDTALHLAAQNNNVPAIKALLSNKAATDITNHASKKALAGTKIKIEDLLAD